MINPILYLVVLALMLILPGILLMEFSMSKFKLMVGSILLCAGLAIIMIFLALVIFELKKYGM